MNKKKDRGTDAVSIVIGTVLLLIIATSIFSFIYYMVLSDQGPKDEMIVTLVGKIEGSNIVLEHQGGESLSLDTVVTITIGEGPPIEITARGNLSGPAERNDAWDLGERILYPFSYAESASILAAVQAVDPTKNAVAFQGVLSLQAYSDVSILLSVNNPSPHPGETILLTITLGNPAGQVNATGVKATINLSENLLFVNSTASNGTYNPITGIWDLIGVELNKISNQTLYIEAEVKENINYSRIPTQLALLFDSSGSVGFENFKLMRNGTAQAMEDDSVFPHDGSVELTVINFCCCDPIYWPGGGGGQCPKTPGYSWADVEVGPSIVTTGNYSTISSDIRTKIEFETGWTATACGLNLAARVLKLSPNNPSQGGDFTRQVIVVMTDGYANAPCGGGSNITTGEASDETAGKASATEARDHVVTVLDMVAGEDAINAMGLGSTMDIDWLRDGVVWAQPGVVVQYDEFPADHGWVKEVKDYSDLEHAMKQMFRSLFESFQVSAQITAIKTPDPNATNNIKRVLITPE